MVCCMTTGICGLILADPHSQFTILNFFVFYSHLKSWISILVNPGDRLDFYNDYKTVFFLSQIFCNKQFNFQCFEVPYLLFVSNIYNVLPCYVFIPVLWIRNRSGPSIIFSVRIRIRIQIQGFDDQKFRRSLHPSKDKSSTSKLEFSSLLWVMLALPGSGSLFPYADPDPADQ